eukprot:1194962-Prorocentrum_minimum.AAC.2
MMWKTTSLMSFTLAIAGAMHSATATRSLRTAQAGAVASRTGASTAQVARAVPVARSAALPANMRQLRKDEKLSAAVSRTATKASARQALSVEAVTRLRWAAASSTEPLPTTNLFWIDRYQVKEVPTKPIAGQATGTSGLRKKTNVFMGENYLANWVQSLFSALPESELKGSSMSGSEAHRRLHLTDGFNRGPPCDPLEAAGVLPGTLTAWGI